MIKPALVPHATLPSWMLTAAKDACVTSKDLCAMYDVSKSTIKRWIAQGLIPQPDFVSHGFSQIEWLNGAFRWRVSTVRKFIKAQNENH